MDRNNEHLTYNKANIDMLYWTVWVLVRFNHHMLSSLIVLEKYGIYSCFGMIYYMTDTNKADNNICITQEFKIISEFISK